MIIVRIHKMGCATHEPIKRDSFKYISGIDTMSSIVFVTDRFKLHPYDILNIFFCKELNCSYLEGCCLIRLIYLSMRESNNKKSQNVNEYITDRVNEI